MRQSPGPVKVYVSCLSARKDAMLGKYDDNVLGSQFDVSSKQNNVLGEQSNLPGKQNSAPNTS